MASIGVAFRFKPFLDKTNFKSKMCALILFHKSVSFPLTNADSMNATYDLILLLCNGVPVV